MESPASVETRQVVWVRNGALASLFLFEAIAWPMFFYVPYFWLLSFVFYGIPTAVWVISDMVIREHDVQPWQPLTAFLCWPIVLPMHLYKTRGWPGIGALFLVILAMHTLRGFMIFVMVFFSLMIYGFPGPG